ncbi:bifunctional serine/threonine-protein kinase/formylglycine-generating enzyme family protein [Fischerella sp. PCC 9605]|uniref:bifunctional serine/threonine-protein kinase/formylglycine-generating enzyme family protein n=1 Tax=Fischerella sp. PCC 9605 TaxID=1173024 RepID=UPI0004AC8419
MLIGQILRNHYQITKLLGSGGFGETYLAEDLDLPNHPVCVVKHLQPKDPRPAVLQIARRLFESEAQVLYRLGNECNQIPRLFAHFEEKGEFYLVQEFVDGEDLSQQISPGKRLSEAEVTKLLQEILEVLTVVHQKNIIHRDIKPQNLMRRRQDGKIVLIDFGAVKEISTLTVNAQGQSSLTVTIGTAGYMPSEQATGQPKLCSDVYAVGMLAIYALTGIQPHQLPKDPTNGEVIWRNWANVSDKLANILTNMVSYHFSQRYQTAAEALHALNPPPQPPPPPPPTNHQPPTINNQQSTSRRKVIQTLGLIGAGFGLAIVGKIQNPGVFETVTVDASGNITKRDRHKAKYFVEDLGNGITLEMVQIPGGTFTMGSPAGEAQRDSDEGPQHQVTVPGFFMGKYEVTQAQYQAIMGNNPSYFKGEKRPVENVSWNDAVEFCKRLSQKTGRTYRLPSEAEWEYACRAGTTTPFYFGETITTDLANYNEAPEGQYRQETTDVGKFPPNSFGLYDMCGNVWEWCLNKYHNNYEEAPTGGSEWLSDDGNDARLLRGGSWNSSRISCRSANRSRNIPENGLSIFGFRLVAVAA